MNKVRVAQRRGRDGWWVFWRELGRRCAKSLPEKRLADHYAKVKYQQLNADVFTGIIEADWDEMVKEYLESYDRLRKTPSARYEAELTLKHFARLMTPLPGRHISQKVVDQFVLLRGREQSKYGKPVSNYTLNKDIANLGAFVRWAQDHRRRYLSRDITLEKVRVDAKDPKPLTADQVKALLAAARARSDCWYMRVLLLLATGLRSGDVESLEVADIDFEAGTVRTRSRKTHKTMQARPLPAAVIPALLAYVAELPEGQRLLASDSNTHKKWKVIREAAGIPVMRIHDLRVTFNSALAQAGVELTTRQRLMEHSDPRLTSNTYTGVDPVLADAVNRLPVQAWL